MGLALLAAPFPSRRIPPRCDSVARLWDSPSPLGLNVIPFRARPSDGDSRVVDLNFRRVLKETQVTIAAPNPLPTGVCAMAEGVIQQQFDAEAGLYYLRNRHYSPVMQRFIQRDPIGLAGGPNQFAYCGGDPVNHVDPSGTIFRLQYSSSSDAQGLIDLLHQQSGLQFNVTPLALAVHKRDGYIDITDDMLSGNKSSGLAAIVSQVAQESAAINYLVDDRNSGVNGGQFELGYQRLDTSDFNAMVLHNFPIVNGFLAHELSEALISQTGPSFSDRISAYRFAHPKAVDTENSVLSPGWQRTGEADSQIFYRDLVTGEDFVFKFTGSVGGIMQFTFGLK